MRARIFFTNNLLSVYEGILEFTDKLDSRPLNPMKLNNLLVIEINRLEKFPSALTVGFQDLDKSPSENPLFSVDLQ
jgi:hypothetical protein